MFFLTRSLALVCLLFFSAVTLCGATDLFGFGQGYLHPTVKVTTQYSDNYKSAATNEISDWKTTLSPGFWVALPATSKKAFSIDSSNAAPGGHGVSRFRDVDYKGFQGSLMYNADIVRSHDHADEDLTKHRGQGMLQYSFAGGLALELSDVYIQSAEEYSETIGNELEEFTSNLATVIAFYDISPKLKMRVGYANFDLDYTSGFNVDFKERTDDRFSTYVLYRILPKTELFLQYDHVDVDYDRDVLYDSTEQHVFVGVKFDTNARINGHMKLGYGSIDSDLPQNNTFEDFIGEALLKYGFNSRSSISLTAKQAVKVTDDRIHQNILHSEVGLAFSQKITHKLGASLKVAYKEDEYRIDSDRSGREDEDHVFGAGVKYAMNDWLSLSADYNYTDRESNLRTQEYTENKLMFAATAAF